MHKFTGILQPFSLLQLVVKDILQTDFEAQLQTPRQIAALAKFDITACVSALFNYARQQLLRLRMRTVSMRITTATFDPVGCLRVTGLQ